MLPIAAMGCIVLVPIHLSQSYVTESANNKDSINPSEFMRLTMTNISQPRIMWIHCVFVLLFVLYTCWVLKVSVKGWPVCPLWAINCFANVLIILDILLAVALPSVHCHQTAVHAEWYVINAHSY